MSAWTRYYLKLFTKIAASAVLVIAGGYVALSGALFFIPGVIAHALGQPAPMSTGEIIARIVIGAAALLGGIVLIAQQGGH